MSRKIELYPKNEMEKEKDKKSLLGQNICRPVLKRLNNFKKFSYKFTFKDYL